MEQVQYFDTFENREFAFRKAVHLLLPRTYAGFSAFWRDMAATIKGLSSIPDTTIACITSNPLDCLAYSSVNDILVATQLEAHDVQSRKLLENAISAFNISPIRKQHIHSLSGGEVVRIALARNYLLRHVCNHVVISSPFSWLSETQHHLYQDFVNAFSELGKPVTVYAMDGENDNEPVDIVLDTTLRSHMETRNVRIRLNDPIMEDQGKKLWASVADVSSDFTSPCLLTGDNGSGKSLIAKALSGAIERVGTARIQTDGYAGRARLLFQDVIAQTLLRPFSVLMPSNSEHRLIKNIYDEIVQEFGKCYTDKGLSVPLIGAEDEDKKLLEYKMMLVAVRLYARPTAIILDEPDWGLAKQMAVAFVVSVAKVAHMKHIPVLLISHKKWWQNITKSQFEVKKRVLAEGECKYEFEISRLRA